MKERENIFMLANRWLKSSLSIIATILLVSPGGAAGAENLTVPKSLIEKYDASLSAVERGNIDAFSDGVFELKNEVYRYGLLSVNSFVDDALSRSFALERNIRLDIVRTSLHVSPLNVKYWLYLGLNDLLDFRVYAFWDDIVNLYYATLKNPVPLLKSLYIVFGFLAMLLLFFVFFFSMAIMLKYISSVVSDIIRVKALKRAELLITPLILLIFLMLTYVLRSPMAVLFFLLAVFSPYMLNRELFLTLILGMMIVVIILFNNKISVYSQMAIFPERKNLLHLTYGIATGVRNVEVDLGGESLMSSAGKARYGFLTGRYRDSVRISDELEKKIGKEYGVMASMGKFYLGDTEGAIDELKGLLQKNEKDPVLLFNLYQLYITDYQFDEASKIQEKAWQELSGNRPFRINPQKIGERILVPPAISGSVLRTFFADQGSRKPVDLPFRNLWLNPLGSNQMYFILLIAIMVLLRALTYNRYIILACRICGDKQLGKGSLKKEDICQYCKTKSLIVSGLAGNPKRSYQIKTHKRAVRLKSLIVPGFGFLAAGSVSMFFVTTFLLSMIMSLFVLFSFSFPGDYSPLYAIISRLGTIVTGGLTLLLYIFFTVSNEIFIRRVHAKYKIDTV